MKTAIMLAALLTGLLAGNSMAATPMPAINPNIGLYEVPVESGVSYDDVIFSLKVISEGKNLVNPVNLPMGEHLKARGQDPHGPLEVRAYCNLSLGADILLDHPEFVAFAPCRIGIYQKQGRLYLALSRPTFDLKSIHNPSQRAQKAAQLLENELIDLMEKARKGDI